MAQNQAKIQAVEPEAIPVVEMARRVLKGSEHAHAGPEGWSGTWTFYGWENETGFEATLFSNISRQSHIMYIIYIWIIHDNSGYILYIYIHIHETRKNLHFRVSTREAEYEIPARIKI